MVKRFISPDDFIESYSKIRQRGGSFLLSKLTLDGQKRTESAFDASAITHANWWIIPAVRRRWNRFISGDPQVNFKQYLMEQHLANAKGLKLLSLGSGSCTHELELAKYPQFEKIVCVDIAQNWLWEAEQIALKTGLKQMEFQLQSIYEYPFPKEHFDVVLFNSSLHHFKEVDRLLEEKVKSCLKPGGMLISNEYVGPDRLQFPSAQIKAINQALKVIDEPYRRRFKTHLIKKRYAGPGYLRMLIADPSECVDSSSILPALRKHFVPIEEKGFGGNLLVGVLKDIAHHFVNADARALGILEELFLLEDDYLQDHPSDFYFGLYQKN